MNKIIVVGHPQSGYERVEELLLACGMGEARPSRREGFMPAQISVTLIKAHGCIPVQLVRTSEQLSQIEVAPIWQGLALDLMLANMEQSLWGWADAQAVYLLDYWKSQDPQAVFVLVFDEPQSVFTRQSLEKSDATPQELEAWINAWIAYNSALLHFHLRNPESSLLVHAGQVQASAQSYLQQVSSRIDAKLQLPSNKAQRGAEPAAVGNTLQASEELQSASLGLRQKQSLEGNILAHWLAQQLLEEHPQAAELYEQLQAAASLPQRGHGQAGRQLLAADLQASHRYRAWSTFVAQQAAMEESTHRLAQLGKTLKEQAQQIKQRQGQIEQLRQVSVAGQQHAQEQERLLANKTSALQTSGQQNQMLLEQLHKVQEELERRYLKAQQQETSLAELSKFKTDLEAAQKKVSKLQETEALARKLKADVQIKAKKLQQSEVQLNKALQAARVKTPSSDLEKENELLITQLHKVQKELERYYLENQQLKIIHKPQPKIYYGAADRVKQQLSYRLGSTMISRARSMGGWLSMPFALRAEARSFKQAQAEKQGVTLPPIAQYRDAHEAGVIKKHLSYRLGARMLSNAKSLSGWLFMPWALYSEVKLFRKERK